MYILRFTQRNIAPNQYLVEISREGKDLPREAHDVNFSFQITQQDHENLRWYLEDYLNHPFDPAPVIAERVERKMSEIGVSLFNVLFDNANNDDTRDMRAELRTHLNKTRIEIVTKNIRETMTIPWELIKDPRTTDSLALGASEFVYAHPSPTRRPIPPKVTSDPIRILLVISRPGGGDDVPYRTIAMEMIKALNDGNINSFQLDVLRPPTFEQLGAVLRTAFRRGKPYHILHFDGHGTFLDVNEVFQGWDNHDIEVLQRLLANLINLDPHRFSPSAIYPRQRRNGKQGYLAFENSQSEYNLRLVDGLELGALLVETEVPILVLNACRSAYTEPTQGPHSLKNEDDQTLDLHAQVQAFGSLAQELMDAGVAGVVAMRYSVYVVTAVKFVAKLYTALTEGQPLGQAVTSARKHLHDYPLRTIGYEPVRLQDWSVPIVYEAMPLRLFYNEGYAQLQVKDSVTSRNRLDPKLPADPDTGFKGRNETLLAIDRAFDRHPIVLLHAYAGSGKTATTAEFARWYAFTGGINGSVIFSSFNTKRTLYQVLIDDFAGMYKEELEKFKNWSAKTNPKELQEIALEILRQTSVLWLWDNVEPIAGFPSSTDSPYSQEEQRELVEFLQQIPNTKAKILLTSRRDERSWLGDLPIRIQLPSMPMNERLQLANALVERYGRYRLKVDHWRALLQFSQGNPLTIIVLARQALCERLQTQDQIEEFVHRVRAGNAVLEDDVNEGRTKSLGAALSYGFLKAFTEEERKQLALLYFFQGYVHVHALLVMDNFGYRMRLEGDDDSERKKWFRKNEADPKDIMDPPEVYQQVRLAKTSLLDRAVEIGLLTSLGQGAYRIHPVLPWYFKKLFEQTYPMEHSEEVNRFVYIFVDAMSLYGAYYHTLYQSGGYGDIVRVIAADEANLLHAWYIARDNGWWVEAARLMRGLRILYRKTGRLQEWERLVDQVRLDCVDPTTGNPIEDRVELWIIVNEEQTERARSARHWEEVKHLQENRRNWWREISTDSKFEAYGIPGSTRLYSENMVRYVSTTMTEQYDAMFEQGNYLCINGFKEAFYALQEDRGRPVSDLVLELASSSLQDLAKVFRGLPETAALLAFKLGNAYLQLPIVRNLTEAEQWYRFSLMLYKKYDAHWTAQCCGKLGLVTYEHWIEALKASGSTPVISKEFNEILDHYTRALYLLPSYAVGDLATLYNRLGRLFHEVGQIEEAFEYYRDAVRYYELHGNRYETARTRFITALLLIQDNRLEDAYDYAEAALRYFQTEANTEVEQEETLALIDTIKKGIRSETGIENKSPIDFKAALAAARPEDELRYRFHKKINSLLEQLEQLSPDALQELADINRQLGKIYSEAGDFDSAESFYREALRLYTDLGDSHQADELRPYFGIVLAKVGRPVEAKECFYTSHFENNSERDDTIKAAETKLQSYKGPTLCIAQFSDGSTLHRIEFVFDGDKFDRQVATVQFDFEVSDHDQEALRWYLEDQSSYPSSEMINRMTEVEGRMTEIGKSLFQKSFQANQEARSLWHSLRKWLQETRIEIVTDSQNTRLIPWELLWSPDMDAPLALSARTIVRSQSLGTQKSQPPTINEESKPLRVLILTYRPKVKDKPDHRSVATRLFSKFSPYSINYIHVDLLRPSTLANLEDTLYKAYRAKQPYHIVHFDGPVLYLEKTQTTIRQSYLVFENLTSSNSIELVNSEKIAKLLVETNVPLLFLNTPEHSMLPSMTDNNNWSDELRNQTSSEQILAYHLFAQSALDNGVPGIVTIPYTTQISTTAIFFAKVYKDIVSGKTLSDAVTNGRDSLNTPSLKAITNRERKQIWLLPVVYESTLLALFPVTVKRSLDLSKTDSLTKKLSEGLPSAPKTGFIGRDEIIFALDRVFDTQSIVLLHGVDGFGKTATAAQFARWYHYSNGIKGPILYTSFKKDASVTQLFYNEFIHTCRDLIVDLEINQTNSDNQTIIDIALQVMEKTPTLWIWDDIEYIFDSSQETELTSNQPNEPELIDFLVKACRTKAKFLLISCYNKHESLGNLPSIEMQPFLNQDSYQLINTLVRNHEVPLAETLNWQPLLDFCQGHPLTTSIVVKQIFRNNLITSAQVETFIAQLKSEEVKFESIYKPHLPKYLSALLNYWFRFSLNRNEQNQLIGLRHFRGFVNENVFEVMGGAKVKNSLIQLYYIHAESNPLLNKVAEIDLLISKHNPYIQGIYSVQSVLTKFLDMLSEMTNSQYEPAQTLLKSQSSRSFVETMAALGDYLYNDAENSGPFKVTDSSYYRAADHLQSNLKDLYDQGILIDVPQESRSGSEKVTKTVEEASTMAEFATGKSVISNFVYEEANFLHAQRLAFVNCWWQGIPGTSRGLIKLYAINGRWVEVENLINGVFAQISKLTTSNMTSEKDKAWASYLEYGAELAMQMNNWPLAEDLYNLLVEYYQQQSADALTQLTEDLKELQVDQIRALGQALRNLALTQSALGKKNSVSILELALALYERLEEWSTYVLYAFDLGDIYSTFSPIFDLAAAEYWYRRSLEHCDENDWLHRAKCLSELARVCLSQAKEAALFGREESRVARHINFAEQYCRQSFNLFNRHYLSGNVDITISITDNFAGAAQCCTWLIEFFDNMGNTEKVKDFSELVMPYVEMKAIENNDMVMAAEARFEISQQFALKGNYTEALKSARRAHQYLSVVKDQDVSERIQEVTAFIKRIRKSL